MLHMYEIVKMTDMIGQKRGNYRLTRLLGSGGFADVYLGENIHLGNNVAIKILNARLNDNGIQQFKNEALTLIKLDHPHIIKILDFGTEDGIPYLIMAYAPNGTLADRHPLGTPMPIATVIAYVRQIAEALQYAHDHNVIHRDVKPENMLVGPNNAILLSDFGIARAMQTYTMKPQTQTSTAEHIIGSFAYMAPEQGAGRAVFASDQYALGVVAYQWLCGRPPFQGRIEELMIQHRLESPPPFPVALGIPSPIENVVMKTLFKDPRQRFGSIQEFATTLEQASMGKAFLKPPASEARPDTSQTPQASDVDSLYRQGVEAYAQGNLEQTEVCWQRVLTLVPNYGNGTLAPRMVNLRNELHPLRVQRLREQALTQSKAAQWQQEIETWNKLLQLQPGDEQAEERIQLAQHNSQYAYMYINAEAFVREGKITAAKTELTTLWNEAPHYGDPAGLAKRVGLEPRLDYEEVKKREQRAREIAFQRERQQLAVQQQAAQRQMAAQAKIDTRKGYLASLKARSTGIILSLFLLLIGTGTTTTIMAGYWTTDQNWMIAVGVTFLFAIIACAASYRKVLTFFPMFLTTLVSLAIVFGITWYLSTLHINYNHFGVSSFGLLGNRTLWIGRQLTFGIIMGLVSVGAAAAFLGEIYSSTFEGTIGTEFFIFVGSGLCFWLILGIISVLFGWSFNQWGWGFGFGWYFPWLSAFSIGAFLEGFIVGIVIMSAKPKPKAGN